MFQFGLVPTTNKPTNITKDTISAIDHIITNSITNSEFETASVTADISDISHKLIFLYKRIVNENQKKTLKSRLQKLLWEIIKKY